MPDDALAQSTTSSTPAIDLTGRSLGEFQIIRRLGKGGMAEVYLAEQTSLKRQVAIKVLRQEFLSDAAYVKRFQHEATAAGGLNHPNIVQVYSIGEQDGIHYIAQEYVRGGNLKDFLKKKGPLDWPMTAFLLKQVAAALQVAGAAGIVHRDVKPENILLTRKGEAKVADFGLAQLTQGGERVALTQVGVTMGTPLYMSPEQVRGNAVDHRSDLYSFGAMAYHMLAGRPPFRGENAMAVAVQHLNETPEPLRSIRPDLPVGACKLIEKMMAKKPEDRFSDAQAVLNELKALQKQANGKSSGATGTLNTNHPLAKSRRWTANLWKNRSVRQQTTGLIVAAIAVTAAAAAYGWSERIGNPFLTTAPPPPAVAHQSTIDGQYFYAMRNGEDEMAWKAVANYPSTSSGLKDEMPRKVAELRLAIIYLHQDRLAEAEQVFNDFLKARSTDKWKEAHGLAGRAILESLRRQNSQSRLTINELDRLIASGVKLDAKLDPLLREAREKNRERAAP
ncbi:protein kinase [bacterium]|nr:protein kinase [bacterium]